MDGCIDENAAGLDFGRDGPTTFTEHGLESPGATRPNVATEADDRPGHDASATHRTHRGGGSCGV